MGDGLAAAIAKKTAEDRVAEAKAALDAELAEHRKEVQRRLDRNLETLTSKLPDLSTEAAKAAAIPPPDPIPGDPGKDGDPGKAGADGRDGDGIRWRGKWSSRARYDAQDAVERKGSSYICTQANQGSDPAKGGPWDLMAEKGQDGVSVYRSGGGSSGGSQTALTTPFTPAGTISATNVQDAIEEVAAEAGSGSGLPAGGEVGQVVVNTGSGTGDWEDLYLPSSGNVWTDTTVVALGYRIDQPGVNLSFLVWEVTDAGTTGGSPPDWEGIPLGSGPITDNDVEWTFQGYVGKALLGQLSIEASADPSGNTGSSVITEDATGSAPGDMYIRGGHGAAGVNGGKVGIQTGFGDGGALARGYILLTGPIYDLTAPGGATAEIYGGDAPTGGTGGPVYLASGATPEADRAELLIDGAAPTSGARIDLKAGSAVDVGAQGGDVRLRSGADQNGGERADVQLMGADGSGVHGKLRVQTNNSFGVAGEFLGSDGNGNLVYATPASGAPADAPYYVTTATGGLSAEVVVPAFIQGLLDDTTAGDARTTLGLGTLATQSGTFSGTSSGTNTGDAAISPTDQLFLLTRYR